MTFCFFELLYGCFMCLIWYRFSGVQELGKFIHTWQFFFGLFAFRAFAGLWGMGSAFQRGVYSTKLYWYLLILNVPITLVCGIPYFRLQCTCSANYRQCEALLAFHKKSLFYAEEVRPEHNIFNVFSPPNKRRFASMRKVPWKEPPARPSPSDTSTRRSPDNSDDAASMLEIIIRQGNSDEAEENTTATEAAPPQTTDQTAEENTTATDAAPPQTTDQTAGAVQGPQLPWATAPLQLSDSFPTSNVFADDFAVAEDGIAWISDSPVESKHCNSEMELSEETYKGYGFGKLALTKQEHPEEWSRLVLHASLAKRLYLCIQDVSCGVVRLEAWAGPDGTRKVQICHLDNQVTPVALEAAYKDDARKFSLQIFFKNLVKADKEHNKEMYDLAFHNISTAEGMHIMASRMAESCRCLTARVGCQVYSDDNTQEEHWCWIHPDAMDACLAANIKMHYDRDMLRYWSTELCSRRSCECSNNGMAPRPSDNSVNQSAVWENGMDYGMHCRKWNTDNFDDAWCYVGLDSTCVDRFFNEAPMEYDVNGMLGQRRVGQFSSMMPCIDEEKQQRNEEEAWHTCIWVKWPVRILCILISTLSIPMSFIILNFLAMRCGDDYHIEDQFTVDFSDNNDNSSEDDFAVEGDTPAGEQK